MSTPIIETKQLKKYFKTGKGLLHAVDGIDMRIEKGMTLGVVGESGCGKSTLGRTILRLQEPTSGEIYFNGEDLLKYSKRQMRKVRREMQIIFQDPYSSINPRMSVSQLIAEPLIINHMCKSRADINSRVDELMDTVGLARRYAGSYPHELDGGRRQRIGVARALAVKPQFIVCDEPVSALDVSIQAQILNLLMDLQEEFSLTYMFITHDLSVVKHISDEVAVMYLGMCVERAKTDELFENPMHPYTQALLSAIPVPSIDPREQEISVIKGELKSPIDPEPGCRFAPRCPYASAACSEKNIPLTQHGDGHYVACTRFSPL